MQFFQTRNWDMKRIMAFRDRRNIKIHGGHFVIEYLLRLIKTQIYT